MWTNLFAVCAAISIHVTSAASVTRLKQTQNDVPAGSLKAMSPQMRRLAETQPAMDRAFDQYTPQLENDEFEQVPGLGRVKLGSLLGRTAYAQVFALASHPRYVIKYKSNCSQASGKVHPLLVDYWLGRIAWKIGVAPEPIFVSPAAATKGSTSPKVKFDMEKMALLQCAVMDKAVVRFMVMERAGTCFTHYGKSPDMERAIRTGIKVTQMLNKLHDEAGVFHGDIHGGNVCESLDDPGKLLLIDFELGGFTESESDEVRPRRRPLHEVLTEWQIAGHSFARRDDVYKTMELMGFLSGGLQFWMKPYTLANLGKTAELLEWKRTGSPFRSDSFDPVANLTHLSVEDKHSVTRTLGEVVQSIRELASVTAVIPYGTVVRLLSAVHSIISIPAASATTTSLPEIITSNAPSSTAGRTTTSEARWWPEFSDIWSDSDVEDLFEDDTVSTAAPGQRKRDADEQRESTWDELIESWLTGQDEADWVETFGSPDTDYRDEALI